MSSDSFMTWFQSDMVSVCLINRCIISVAVHTGLPFYWQNSFVAKLWNIFELHSDADKECRPNIQTVWLVEGHSTIAGWTVATLLYNKNEAVKRKLCNTNG